MAKRIYEEKQTSKPKPKPDPDTRTPSGKSLPF